MARVLVTEKLAETGLEKLRAAGHEVDLRLGLSPDELVEAVVGAQGLLIRSATNVTEEVLTAGSELIAVGRAGIGLDNVDVEAATRLGVLVANAPQSNIVSAAEHAVALLMSLARNIPQAHTALTAGRWERAQWGGVELFEKTLGIVGLGRIGCLVAQRMRGFGMHLIAYDPYVSKDLAEQMGVELCGLDELMTQSDFITVHLPKLPETLNLIAAPQFAMAKSSMQIVNAARGGIVNETDLAAALSAGEIGGAALDVFDREPTTESPLFGLPNVVVTPHLGASTTEAQDKAGVTVAEQLLLAFSGDFVPFAVNVSASAASALIKPYQDLGERMGSLFASLMAESASRLEIEFCGPIAAEDCSILRLCVLKGLLGRSSSDTVSYVNAPQLAQDRGLEVSEIRSEGSLKYVNLVAIRNENHELLGTLVGSSQEPRIVGLDGFVVEIPLAKHLLAVRNSDEPGIVGVVGSILGEAGINISDLSLGRGADGLDALMLIATDESIEPPVLEELQAIAGLHSARILIA